MGFGKRKNRNGRKRITKKYCNPITNILTRKTMTKIKRFALGDGGETVIAMPNAARIIGVKKEFGKVYLMAVINTKEEMVEHYVKIVVEDQNLDDYIGMEYVGSFKIQGATSYVLLEKLKIRKQ